jgi:arginine/lysine/ornithine decarboxylase
MNTNIHFLSYLAQFFLEREMIQTIVAGKIKIHILFSIFFLKSCRLWDNVEKLCKAKQTTDDNMVRAHCVLPN